MIRRRFVSLRKHPTCRDTTRRYFPPSKRHLRGRLQKFHTDDASLPRSGQCFWLVVLHGKFASANQKHYTDLGSDASSLRSFLRCRRHYAGKPVVSSQNVLCLLTPGFVAGFCLCPPPPTLAIHPSSKLNGEMSKSYGILYCWKYVFLYHSLHEQDWIIVWSHLFATQSFYSKRTSFPVSRFLRSVRALTLLGREILETRFVGLIDEPLVHYNALKTKFTDVTISAGIFTYHSRLWKWAAFESQWSSSKERMLLNRL